MPRSTATTRSAASHRKAVRHFESSLRGVQHGGVNHYVTLPDLGIAENQTAWAVAFWFRPTGVLSTTFGQAVSEGDLNPATQAWGVYVNDKFGVTGRRMIRWRIQDIAHSVVNFNVEYAPANWTHVFCVNRTTTSREIWVNGVLQGTNTATVTFTDTSFNTILGVRNTGAYAQTAQADLNDVLWYKAYAPTQAEIEAYYFDAVLPTTGLVARYKCTEGSGTVLTDSAPTPSGNGTLVGSATWSSTSTAGKNRSTATARTAAA